MGTSLALNHRNSYHMCKLMILQLALEKFFEGSARKKHVTLDEFVSTAHKFMTSLEDVIETAGQYL